MATYRRLRTRSEVLNPPPISKLFGNDLLLEILIRLPNPESACRCKLVSKRWRSLISDPFFNRRFVSHHQSMYDADPPLYFRSDFRQSIPLNFLPVPDEGRDRFIVYDSFKDLLLCGFYDLDRKDDELGRSYLLCNLFTEQWIALPLAPEKAVRYLIPEARLVCEPRISTNLDLGDCEVCVYSADYRFRVVSMYQDMDSLALKLDMFCSECGQWTKGALVLDDYIRMCQENVVSCNGKLFWSYWNFQAGVLDPFAWAAFNPFRPDKPPTSFLDHPEFIRQQRNVSVSRGALYMIVLETETQPTSSWNALSVWRLEEDGESWRIQYETMLNASQINYKLEHCSIIDLHPEKPEIVFLECSRPPVGHRSGILSCDLRKGELKFFSEITQKFKTRLTVFQPRVSCWPTPIPRYEGLRGIYDGSYNLAQNSVPTTPSATGFDGVKQTDCWRKGNISAPCLTRCVKKRRLQKAFCS